MRGGATGRRPFLRPRISSAACRRTGGRQRGSFGGITAAMTTVSSTTSTTTTTTAASSGYTALTSSGSGTGIDYSTLIEAKVNARLTKADRIDAKITTNEAKITALHRFAGSAADGERLAGRPAQPHHLDRRVEQPVRPAHRLYRRRRRVQRHGGRRYGTGHLLGGGPAGGPPSTRSRATAPAARPTRWAIPAASRSRRPTAPRCRSTWTATTA